MGEVYRARDTRLECEVAINVAGGRQFVKHGTEVEAGVANIAESLPRVFGETSLQKPSSSRRESARVCHE